MVADWLQIRQGTWIGWVFFAILALSGCSLGDERLAAGPDGGGPTGMANTGGSDDGPSATPTGDSEPSGEATCTPGVHRCNPTNPALLEVCDPLTSSGWSAVETCTSADLCDADGEACRVCTPGAYWCDSWRLKTCNSSGSDWILIQECESPEYCDSRGAQCADCLPGEGYCSGSTLLSCNVNRDGYAPTECDSVNSCNVTSMSCRTCIPGEYQCNVNELMRCNDEREWELEVACVTGALCTATRDLQLADPERTPACVEPACEPGQFQCGPEDGRNLYGCPPSRDAWALLSVCATPELCNAASGSCDAAVCSPGSYQCNGMALQVCNATGTAWDTLKTCASADQCNTAQRDCIACSEGDAQCSDANLQVCDSDATWATTDSCVSSGLCTVDDGTSATARCDAPACELGERRCNAAQLEQCNADRNGWEVLEMCQTEGLCNAIDGRCDAAGCMVGSEIRCQNNALQQCRVDLTGWDVLMECAAGSACDIETMGCIQTCPAAPYRCNGAQPEQCAMLDDGTVEWQVIAAPCATSGLCQASATGASCQPAVCGGALIDYRCNPGNPLEVQRCNETRTGWNLSLTCSNGEVCDPGPGQEGPAQCDICTPNSWSCTGGVLSQCGPNGQILTALETCSDQAHCVVGANATSGHCLRCDAGQTQCNSANLDTCAPDRRGWVQATMCDPSYGCHDNPGNADYCNACSAPGARVCEDDSTLLTCNAQQTAFDGGQVCAFGCREFGTDADYCQECEPNTAECSADEETDRRVCGADGRWSAFTACPNGSLCYDSGEADYCGSCIPDSQTCISSTQYQTCDDDGTPGGATNCPTATPVCLGSTNSCVACNPSAPAQCTGGTGTPDRRVCTTAGAWMTSPCSGTTPVCLAGACVSCAPGADRCTGTTVGGREQCSAGGAWVVANCAASSAPVCFGGDCVECNPNTAGPRCTTSGGSGRQVCDAGSWVAENCATGDVCVGGECLECDPATQTPECTGAAGTAGRRTCVDGEWEPNNCAEPTAICAAGACVCNEGGTRCSMSGARQRCTGGTWVDTPCTTGYCEAGGCVDCLDNEMCTADLPLCVAGACKCQDGAERCNASGTHQVCENGAWSSAPCSGATPICGGDGTCVCMTGATRCSMSIAQTCVAGVWQNDAGSPACTSCMGDTDCLNTATTPVCNGVVCVACNGDCPMGLACAASGACVECTATDTSNCASGVCDANACVECTTTDTSNCASGVCDANACVECATDSHCTAENEPVCDANTCRGCAMDGECAPPLVCDPGGSCVECTTDSHCMAENAPVCDANVCRGCATDGECTAPLVCDPGGSCVACVDAGDCPLPGQPLCVANVCAPCTDTCPTPGDVCMNGACVPCILPDGGVCP